ncbi:MAG: RNase adapter RapZ [Firmicutes bacterium]|nr:RNase adapter RapZ [Bacillota bacterium]
MKIIIVTGLSGSGKTQAMDVLEDMGYYCIDNMPPLLIKNFLDIAAKNKELEKAAFGIDVRGGSLFDDLKDTMEAMKKEDVDFKILFLEASDKVLARRYNETRREHPLAHGEAVAKGIKREKERLEAIRKEADAIIDTSYFNNAQLAAEIRNIVSEGKDNRTFTVNIMSFGYKNGMPISADMVFDARFLPNPFYVEELKHLTGNDEAVRNYVMSHDIAKLFADEVRGMIEVLIPFYKKEGKFSLSVCFGCTGGHHRSVTLANDLNDRLTAKGIRTTLEHRDL